ncbi:hypothetical protein BCV69DRAFT_301556 [Microstroma glucosiphilum]|uniref:Uncharacterized protein n=1 Tax=Pseudomicrostroma glucosiphilum TaxID=1684307 RepID=A0A316TYG5_9BASI|nr:hypothetical protein BCV69DRAFT_301556 [Pseudomicrostroma glucosiphilum]PWN18100.1 hypothetical protein BCV69DRAFT_301556 [Pseudomicrostroma glucosiphilum]
MVSVSEVRQITHCPTVKQVWGDFSPQTLAKLAVSFMDESEANYLLTRGRSTLAEPEGQRLSGMMYKGPGMYVHVIETEEDVLTCYVGKSDSSISKRLGRHQESQEQGDESPLYCLKRAFPASQVHEKTLLRLPTPNNLKRTCKTLADDKSLKKLHSYPAWALTNTFNSLLEGTLIAHFAAFHGRHAWYDAQWDKIFGAKARKDLAGCNRTPGTESDSGLKRWRYEPRDANGSKGVRTLED